MEVVNGVMPRIQDETSANDKSKRICQNKPKVTAQDLLDAVKMGFKLPLFV